jgi:hypothetical protein
MLQQLNSDALLAEIKDLVLKYGIDSLGCSVSLTVSREVFEQISKTHKGYRSDFMLADRGIGWYLQIKKAADNENTPDGAILQPRS